MSDSDCPSREQVVENLKALPRECATWPTLTKAVLGRVGTRDEVVDRLVELLGWRPVGIQTGDSWEQLEQDAKEHVCAYTHPPKDKNGNPCCEGCRFEGLDCWPEQVYDVYDRAAQLAGGEGMSDIEAIIGDLCTRNDILNGPFDVETHKQHFVHYLEICIDPAGVPHYAVPSHTRWLLNRFMEREGLETDLEAWERIPAFDCLEWLCSQLGCIAVWEYRACGEPNEKQLLTLRELRDAGLFRGDMGNEAR